MTPDEVPAPHHEFFCSELEKIERREIMRAAYSCPPGHAKTKFFSRYFAAWYLGRNPSHRFLQGGHSQAFVENEIGRYVRDIVAEERYSHVFPDIAVSKTSKAAGSWRLAGKRGAYVAKGAGQGISGYRGHIGCIDDPFADREDAQSPTTRKKVADWLFTDFRTRLLPHSPLYIVATRWHQEDLIGRVEAQSRLGGKGIPWRIVNLPALIETEEEMALDPLGRDMGEALWGDFYTVEELLEQKYSLPAGDWQALFQGRPTNIEGNVVKQVWFKRYERLPTNVVGLNEFGDGAERVKRITLSVDCANKTTARSNFSVITVWFEDYRGNHYLADVVRRKLEFTDLAEAIARTARKWNAGTILVEDAGAGVQILQQYAGKMPAPMIGMPTGSKSKEFRFDGVTPMFEAGEVWLPKSAPWLTDYEGEILSFPNGDDDQVDSTSQYLAWARKRGKYGARRLRGTAHAH